MTLDMTLDPEIAEELTPTMYSHLNLETGSTAYIVGNGMSRVGLDLELLGGDIWGCNALFRDYTPDYLTIVNVVRQSIPNITSVIFLENGMTH